MAVFDEIEGNVVAGVAAGVGAALLAPVILPAVVRIARPALKGAIKAGLLVYDTGRETVSEFREMTEDIAAEARAEMAQPAAETGPGAGGAARTTEEPGRKTTGRGKSESGE